MTHALSQDVSAAERRERFAESGYLVLPGLLPENLLHRLLPEVDRWVDEGLRDRSIAACLDPEGATPARPWNWSCPPTANSSPTARCWR
ncbi:hypothetical protein UIS43_04825 [Nocardiopsis sp. LDBS0036]|uniref:hypothetical protein n=1 Tax=Nocardiopsis sp. LDBS0036 TaxID=3104276 RepID=UPI00351353CA